MSWKSIFKIRGTNYWILVFDDWGATYGVIGAFGSVLMILLTLLACGWIAILLSKAALAGGFNGGALSRYRGKRK